jgi:hypothetical protein
MDLTSRETRIPLYESERASTRTFKGVHHMHSLQCRALPIPHCAALRQFQGRSDWSRPVYSENPREIADTNQCPGSCCLGLVAFLTAWSRGHALTEFCCRDKYRPGQVSLRQDDSHAHVNSRSRRCANNGKPRLDRGSGRDPRRQCHIQRCASICRQRYAYEH